MGKIRVIYLRNTFIHVCAEMLKITFTFSMLSCDWRDDQIRILQGNSVLPMESYPACLLQIQFLFKNNAREKQRFPVLLVLLSTGTIFFFTGLSQP